MIRVASILFLFFNIAFSQMRLATVSGNVYLSDQTTDHSGVKIVFEAVSASATSDSTVSNSDGSYNIGLNDGIYTITMEKAGYIPNTLAGNYTFADGGYLIDDITLQVGSILEVS